MSETNPKILIVEARFYEDVADALVAGATKVIEDAGMDAVRVPVPGVFEVPAAVRRAWATGKFDGCVTLGCVIRGETDHYDHICREVSRTLMDQTVDHVMPHGFGILTCENRDQAWERADVVQRDIGGRAAEACLRMIEVEEQFSSKSIRF